MKVKVADKILGKVMLGKKRKFLEKGKVYEIDDEDAKILLEKKLVEVVKEEKDKKGKGKGEETEEKSGEEKSKETEEKTKSRRKRTQQ